MPNLSATLEPHVPQEESDMRRHSQGELLLQNRDLERFLADVERRAFRIARIGLRNDEDALDAVQDAMLKLAQGYAHRPSAEWAPLLYRILQNRIRDGQRRRQTRNRIFAWLPGFDQDDSANPQDNAPADQPGEVERLMAHEAMHRLEQCIAELPQRQQQAFMLRNFEGLDVAQTASAMGCSEGSVKTHYSRAVHTLRQRLGDAW